MNTVLLKHSTVYKINVEGNKVCEKYERDKLTVVVACDHNAAMGSTAGVGPPPAHAHTHTRHLPGGVGAITAPTTTTTSALHYSTPSLPPHHALKGKELEGNNKNKW